MTLHPKRSAIEHLWSPNYLLLSYSKSILESSLLLQATAAIIEQRGLPEAPHDDASVGGRRNRTGYLHGIRKGQLSAGPDLVVRVDPCIQGKCTASPQLPQIDTQHRSLLYTERASRVNSPEAVALREEKPDLPARIVVGVGSVYGVALL